MVVEPLPSGAEIRTTGSAGGRVVLCVNGGTAAAVPGTWSASVEWLVRRLAPRFGGLSFVEVRYRVKSWHQFERCVQDAAEALAAARGRDAGEVLLLGFSMGGAVGARIAADPAVAGLVGLAAWLPPQLDLRPLAAKRVTLVHGSLDAPFPGVPGVRPSVSAAAAERLRALGADVSRHVIRGATHAIALRSPTGRAVPMPRARRWEEAVAAELERFCA